MREAYRLNKHCLADHVGLHFLIGYIYIGSGRLYGFKAVQKRVVASLHDLNDLYTRHHHDSLQA